MALLLGVAATLIAWLASVAISYRRWAWIGWLANLLLLGILFSPVLFSNVSTGNELLVTIGVGFFCLKSISVVLDSWRLEQRYSLVDVFFLNFFFPVFSAGPIEQITTLNSASLNVSFDLDLFVEGLMRLVIGMLKYYFVAASLFDAVLSEYFYRDGLDDMSSPAMFLLCIGRWLSLYLLFSGYSDIAIGTSKMFGVKVRENFNYPFLSDSIQNYWQRWHISLMNFMSQYVYIAFVRRTGLRVVGIGVVFICTALWHNVNENYLIWGVLHATAMMGYYWYSRKVTEVAWLMTCRKTVAYNLAARVVTLSFVVIVSAIGTAATFDEAKWIMRSLLPGV